MASALAYAHQTPPQMAFNKLLAKVLHRVFVWRLIIIVFPATISFTLFVKPLRCLS